MSDTEAIQLVGIDWGSTSLRMHLLGHAGKRLATRVSAQGMATLACSDDFTAVLTALLADIPATAPVLLAGMVGARGGWRETGYVDLPVTAIQMAAALIPVDFAGRPVAIVPGVCAPGDSFSDVMRGEEVQAFGTSPATTRIVAPGTHSKWMEMRWGTITGFSTCPTGELYAVLMQHSLLGRDLPHHSWDDDAFLSGVATARAQPNWLHQLFGVRARHVRNSMPADTLPAFLSGLLIGYECINQRAGDHGKMPLTVIGNMQTAALYALALAQFNVDCTVMDGDQAFATGIWRIEEARTHR